MKANIVLEDDHCKLWFYKETNGNPELTTPVLRSFLRMVKQGKIKDNSINASCWLIECGVRENLYINSFIKRVIFQNYDDIFDGNTEVGSIEPTAGRHHDINFLYVIKLYSKELEVYSVDNEYELIETWKA